jgi:hypothetical protein
VVQEPERQTESGLTAGEALSGGCQCGAVRFRAQSLKGNAHVCHCRMCQKAAGNFFMALVGVPREHLSWTRGAPAHFATSEHVGRGFCRNCGTPLSFEHDQSEHVSISIGAFDKPAQIALRFQLGMEGRLPQVDQLANLMDHGTTEDEDHDGVAGIRSSNRQHPDEDTLTWLIETPAGRRDDLAS